MSETTPTPTGQIFALIPKVMKAVGHISKDRKNQQQGYQFRGIDDVYAAVQGPMAEHGLTVIPRVTKREVTERQTKGGGTLFYTILTVDFDFYAMDGSHVTATTVGEAMDSGDKSTNKAMSAAMKYAMLQVFCIPTEESGKDTEDQTHDVVSTNTAAPSNRPPAVVGPATDAQLAEIKKLAEETKADRTAFLKTFNVVDTPELTSAQAATAIAMLKKKKAAQVKKPTPANAAA